jgi:hypothetical protein
LPSRLDQLIYDLLAIFHHPLTDLFFATLTWLGSAPAVMILGALALFTLIINNRDFSALVLIFGLAGGELFAFLAKIVFARPRPILRVDLLFSHRHHAQLAADADCPPLLRQLHRPSCRFQSSLSRSPLVQ